MPLKKIWRLTAIKNELVFGTWEFELKKYDEERITEIIEFAISRGIVWYDTALSYSHGLIEKILSNYNNIKIITKIPAIRKPSKADNDINILYSKNQIEKCVEKSINNLKGPPEVFLLHNWHESWQDVEFIINHLETLKSTKKCKFVGISLPNGFDGELPMEILESIDCIMAPLNDENNWILENYNLLKRYNIEILARSLFKGGKIKSNNLRDAYKILSAAKQADKIIIGMSTEERVIENMKIISAFNKNLEIISDDERTITVKNENNEYVLNKNIYAALSHDKNNPLSTISKSSNSFSIDSWRGCPLDCAYCHVQDSYSDLENWSNKYKPVKRSRFSEEQIADALMSYKEFIPNESLISLCTSSTEPFITDDVTDSVLKVMECFVKKGLKNPFWIVTKSGDPPQKFKERFKNIVKNNNAIIVSICWTNNKKEIEPHSQDRFKNLDFFVDCGIGVSWHMRPLHNDWNASYENIDYIIGQIANKSAKLENIVVGGLRWTHGVEFGIKVIRGLEMPPLIKENNIKTLSFDKMIYTKQKIFNSFGSIPVYFKSSCSICHILKMPNFSGVYNSRFCELSNCPDHQRIICQVGAR